MVATTGNTSWPNPLLRRKSEGFQPSGDGISMGSLLKTGGSWPNTGFGAKICDGFQDRSWLAHGLLGKTLRSAGGSSPSEPNRLRQSQDIEKGCSEAL